jgi:hypothetical protein
MAEEGEVLEEEEVAADLEGVAQWFELPNRN